MSLGLPAVYSIIYIVWFRQLLKHSVGLSSIKNIVDEVELVDIHEYVLDDIETYEEWFSFRKMELENIFRNIIRVAANSI